MIVKGNMKGQLTSDVAVEEGSLINYMRPHMDTLIQNGLTPMGGISTATLPGCGPVEAFP